MLRECIIRLITFDVLLLIDETAAETTVDESVSLQFSSSPAAIRINGLTVNP